MVLKILYFCFFYRLNLVEVMLMKKMVGKKNFFLVNIHLRIIIMKLCMRTEIKILMMMTSQGISQQCLGWKEEVMY